MKIVLICGSIERGADGVGDYTRRLSQSLLEAGHQPYIIALRDGFVENQQREIIESELGAIRVLRLPVNKDFKVISNTVKLELNEINPDWVSLQFVIFAFHPKGLPFWLPYCFSRMLKGYKVQVMFHELWLGMDQTNSLKHLVWGFFQKQIILRFIRLCKPAVIHTNSNWYAKQLNHIATKVNVLPLFSNIPVVKAFLPEKREVDFLSSNKANIRFVIFGHISLFAPVESFVEELKKIANQYHKRFEIVFVGKNNEDLDRWKNCWAQYFDVEVLGIQPEFTISQILSGADIGIATTPYVLLGKSGSFFALLDHGLPVINVSDLNELKSERASFQSPQGLYEYHIGNLEKIFLEMRGPKPENKLEISRDIFLNDLINTDN